MGVLGKASLLSGAGGLVYWWHKAGQAAVELEEEYYKQVIAANAATAATTIWNNALAENAELLKDVESIENKITDATRGVGKQYQGVGCCFGQKSDNAGKIR